MAERTILVIDDEERLASSLAELLRAEGYHAQFATGGAQGLAMLRREPYSLVITDLRMPEVDGFQVMEELARSCPETAVIVITAHASTESAIHALRNQVADYVTKPFEFDLLKAAIEKVFARLETEQLRRDTVRMITHDIKVPLSSILGYAEFLVDQKTGLPHPQVPEFAGKIQLNCQRILDLLDNFLMHAQAEGGRLVAHRQLMDLANPVREALHMLREEFRQKRIEVDAQYPEKDLHLQADEPLVFRAVVNLLGNALKYTPRGGQVVVRIRKELNGQLGEEAAVLEVRNTGPGIPEEDLPWVFERDRRSTSSRGTVGSGLGLYVVRHVARAHDGLCEAESTPEEWTAFRLVLPLG